MAAGSRREPVWVSAIVLAAGLALTFPGVQHPGPNGRSLTAVSFSLSISCCCTFGAAGVTDRYLGAVRCGEHSAVAVT